EPYGYLRDSGAISKFSIFFEETSQIAKILSDQNFLWPKMSETQVQTVLAGILQGVGRINWVAAGIFLIGKIFERCGQISVNDRDCKDLLKDMLEFSENLKNIGFWDKMPEVLQFIFNVAKWCDSYTGPNKLLGSRRIY
ncbi:hypothetical protein KI387_033707, partial [Taxus chinensis]